MSKILIPKILSTLQVLNTTKKNNQVLLIEDDQALASVLSKVLSNKGFTVEHTQTGSKGLRHILSRLYSVVLLDIGLPDINGVNLVKKVRAVGINIPIIAITDNISTETELSAFDVGTNLFHRKPINFDLLLKQIQSMLMLNASEYISYLGEYEIDYKRRIIKKKNKQIKLSSKEFDLLTLLVNAKGKILTRQNIIYSTMSGIRDVEDGSVDTLVSRLRKKLGDTRKTNLVETVYKQGYRINVDLLD